MKNVFAPLGKLALAACERLLCLAGIHRPKRDGAAKFAWHDGRAMRSRCDTCRIAIVRRSSGGWRKYRPPKAPKGGSL